VSPPPSGPPASASTPAPTGKSPRILLSLSLPNSEYRATWDEKGGIASPSIPVTLGIRNLSAGAWRCTGQFELTVEAKRSGRKETRRFPIRDPGCALDIGEDLSETTEVGPFLTEMASYSMKGDELSLSARVVFEAAGGASAVSLGTAPLVLRIFVPEG
jgi:hypothetical protein